MTALTMPRPDVAALLNHLRRGSTYRATTRTGVSVGEYLGIEAPYGEWAILLRHGETTESIALGDVARIVAIAA